MSFNRKNSRKRNRDELNSLVESRGDSEDEMRDRKAVQTILFQNEDLPLILNERSSYFTSGKTNYDEELIGADNFWHQIIVSWIDRVSRISHSLTKVLRPHRLNIRRNSMLKRKFFPKYTKSSAMNFSPRLRIVLRERSISSSCTVKERLWENFSTTICGFVSILMSMACKSRSR